MATLAELNARRAELLAQLQPIENALRAVNNAIAAKTRPWDHPEVRGECCESAIAAGTLNAGVYAGTRVGLCPTCGKVAALMPEA